MYTALNFQWLAYREDREDLLICATDIGLLSAMNRQPVPGCQYKA